MRRDTTNILDAFSTAGTIRRGRRDNLLNFTRTLDKACHRQIRPSLVTRVCKSVEDYARNTRDVFHGPATENCDSSIALHSTENNFLVRENGLEIGDDRIYRAFPTANIAKCILVIFSFFTRTMSACFTLCYFAIVNILNVKK